MRQKKKREGKEALPWQWRWGQKRREKRGYMATLSFICPWLALRLQVGIENMHLFASEPRDIGGAFVTCQSELGMGNVPPQDQETFPIRSKDQSPVEHRVKGLWPPLMFITSHRGPCAPMSVLVGSFFQESYLLKVTQWSSEGPDR